MATRKKKTNPVKVVQDKDKPVPTKVLAAAITEISKSFSRLRLSGLNRKAIVALIHDDTKLAKRDINTVIDSLATLEKRYCG